MKSYKDCVNKWSALMETINSTEEYYPSNKIIDIFSSILIAKIFSKGRTLSNINDVNNVLSVYSPDLVSHCELQESLYSTILKELEYSSSNISLILNYASKCGLLDDYLDKRVSDLARIVNIKKEGKIANINCISGSFIREIVKHNEFKGQIHLYSGNKLSLKLSYLNISQVTKNIIVHKADVKEMLNNDKFDFIYTMPPMSERNDTIGTYISVCQDLLAQEGKLLLLVPKKFLINSKHDTVRLFIRENFRMDAIIEAPSNALPYIPIDIALLLLENSMPLDSMVFVARLEPSYQWDEDLKVVIDSYYDHINGITTENVSPMTNRVEKRMFTDSFLVITYNPYIQKLEQNIPKPYEIRKLSDVCNLLVSTHNYGNNDYLNKKTNTSVAYIRIQDMKDGHIDTSSSKFVEIKNENDKHKLTKLSDVILSKSGSIGKLAIVDQYSENCLVTHGAVILRAYKEIIDPLYLYKILDSKYVTAQLEDLTTGNYIRMVPMSGIKALKIPVIPIKKQKEIIGRINNIEEEIKTLRFKEEALEKQLKSITKEVFD